MSAGDSLSRQHELRRAMAFSLVPGGVALLLGLLLAPRPAIPDSVPLPIPDVVALARTRGEDAQFAEAARREPLAPKVRALGTALRNFHTEEASAATTVILGDARRQVDSALIEALPLGDEPLLRLRAAEMMIFVREIGQFESTGVESDELKAVAGGFVQSMRAEGWVDGHHLAARGDALFAMYKQMWNAFLGLEARKPFALSLDEERAIYAFYLLRPHPSPAMRGAILAARRGATDSKAQLALDEAERSAVEAWRIERIAKLAAIDPAYPAAYARGAASLRRGDYKAAENALREWLAEHPEGPLALRAQNYLRECAHAGDVD